MIVVPKSRITAYKKLEWWGSELLDDLFKKHVAEKPLEPALVDPPNTLEIYGREPKRLNWAETEELVTRYASIFVKHGFKKDDALLVQLPNIADLTAVYLACAQLGIIVSPAPSQYRESELAYIAERVDAKAILTASRIGNFDHGAMASRLKRRSPVLDKVFCLGGSVEDTLDVESELARITAEDCTVTQAVIRNSSMSADDIFTICWTSGTESSPKGVPRSHNEWLIIAAIVVEGNEVRNGAHLLNPFPMVNMAGIATSFMSWLLTGGVLVQHHPFDLPIFIQQIRDESIENTSAPPAVLNLLLQNEEMLDGIDFRRLKTIGSGSAPLSEWMVRTFHEKYDVRITNLFGSNEGTVLLSSFRDVPDPALRAKYFPRFAEGFKWHSTFCDGVRSRIVDPATEDEIFEAGQVGELRVKGPTVFSGYWKSPELNSQSFDKDGWFKTGDLFKISGDRKEFFEFSGRLKDIVIRGGMNISPEQIETLLMSHPAIVDAAVVGAPDKHLGERVCAFVVAQPNQSVDLKSINSFLTQEKGIAVFKQVERLEIVETLPRNPVGKILKSKLREGLAL